MEDPLISEEAGGPSFTAVAAATVLHSGMLRRRKPLPDRLDAIRSGSKYQKAATLVDLAEDGVGLPEEVLDDSNFQRAAKFYFMFTRVEFLWSLNLFALVILNFLEKPLWCDALGKSVCEDRDHFYLGQLPYLTGLGSLIFEVVTLFILSVHTFFPIIYEGLELYWKNNLNILKVISLLLLLVDLFVYLAGFLPFRVAPYIRIVFVILNVRELRSCMVTLGGMMMMYLNVLVIWSLFILFSSWMAYVIFEDTEQGRTIFYSFHETLYQMVVLFTTSNNPDVWIPGYKKSRWSCIFFILYVLVGVYFLTNLILAVVYDSFKAQLAKQVLKMDTMRNRILKRAFKIIDSDNTGTLNKAQCIHLFEELNNYRSLPKISSEDYELIFNELDDSGDFQINLEEFSDLCDAIAFKFEKEPSPSWLEYCPGFYHSVPINSLKAFVISPMFGYVVVLVLLLNAVTVIIETTLDIQNSSGQKFWLEVEFVFGWIYVLEMALKIFSLGLSKYWMEGQNQFDFVVTWIIVIGETITLFFPDMLPFLSNGEWIRYLLIARMLRLVRLIPHVGQSQAFVATFLSLIPSLAPYLGTVFCLMCIYCTLGIQVFGGLVNAGNPKVAATDLSDNDYLLFNFNDYPNGMVTLFNLLVMGNWQAWMQSYKDLTGTYWSLAYFISFYLIAILLLLNLIVAFVLEAFQAELDLEEQESVMEDELGRKRRRIGVKSRSRIVDKILHRILSDQLQ